MKARMSIKSIIIVMATICLASMFFINVCFATNTGKISAETARLREKPQTDATVLELVSLGQNVEILEEVDGWYKVKYKEITGYIRKDLLEVKNEETNSETDNKENENVQSEGENIQESINNETSVEKTKIRIVPLINALEIGEIEKDSEVEVTEVINDWTKIKTSDGKEGWIVGKIVNESPTENKNSEEKTTTKTMYVNSQTINVRQKADKTSEVIKQLSINTSVTVISTENGWSYVDINGTKGYIAENLLSNTKKETSRGTLTERNTTSTNKKTDTTSNTQTSTANTQKQTSTANTGSAVVAYAQKFLGCKYVYGGTTTNGFDCSGFTQFVYKHFGVNLNRTAAAQYSNGTSVKSLQVGDLVMFGKSGINHVGIYIGGNRFIHAANPSRGVTTDTLSSGYYKTNYVGARRIF